VFVLSLGLLPVDGIYAGHDGVTLVEKGAIQMIAIHWESHGNPMNQNLPVETDTSGIELCLSYIYIANPPEPTSQMYPYI
jgi:hypothetical protein